MIFDQNIRSVRSLLGALELLSTLGYDARKLLAASGRNLLGAPVDENASLGHEAQPESLQLISCEVLITGVCIPPASAMEPAQITLLSEPQPTLGDALK